MTVVGREQSIGESIRQLRRQQNLTQSELGGERYSKSYISALERDKITPSFQALQFFAEQLRMPDGYFTTLFEQTEHIKQLAVLYEQKHSNNGQQFVSEGEWDFLDVSLQWAEDYRCLGAYSQASEMYEQARAHLNGEHDMKRAGSLYLGLGYCAYAIAYSTTTEHRQSALEDIQYLFQRAISILVQ